MKRGYIHLGVLYRYFRCLVLNISLCICGLDIHAQDLSGLSDQGYGHWMAASKLAELATNVDDYVLIAKEYEEVIETDPSFIEAYMKLVQVYEKIVLEKGEPYFSKAEAALNQYAVLNPGDNRNIQSEKAFIQALRSRYYTGPYRFDGRWCYKSNKTSGNWFIQIKWEGDAYQITFKQTPEAIESINSTTWDVTFARQEDRGSELRSRHTRYEGDCSSSADPGFPTYGKYYYNSWRTEDIYRITLEGTAPHVRLYKQHCFYYQNGSLTYSETLTNELYFIDNDLVRE